MRTNQATTATEVDGYELVMVPFINIQSPPGQSSGFNHQPTTKHQRKLAILEANGLGARIDSIG